MHLASAPLRIVRKSSIGGPARVGESVNTIYGAHQNIRDDEVTNSRISYLPGERASHARRFDSQGRETGRRHRNQRCSAVFIGVLVTRYDVPDSVLETAESFATIDVIERQMSCADALSRFTGYICRRSRKGLALLISSTDDRQVFLFSRPENYVTYVINSSHCYCFAYALFYARLVYVSYSNAHK